jgi:hypothetical protein
VIEDGDRLALRFFNQGAGISLQLGYTRRAIGKLCSFLFSPSLIANLMANRIANLK